MAIIRLQSETDKLERQYYEFDPESKELGQGGMGVVYKGRLIHADTARIEDVAIKVLYKDLPEEAVTRALLESNIIIYHDNVIRMRGSISTKDVNGNTRHHVISEYLDGETLDKLLEREGKLSEMEALNIIKNVLSGLSAIHNRKLVHRDIDPSNIMICRDGRVKIIDMGVAKDMNITGVRQTMIGQFIGKVAYASPEQLSGLQMLVKQTSDIYSTGIVLYELLTGKLPFTGTTYEVTEGHKEKPVPLDKVSDKYLCYIIKKATAKKVNDRYQSAYEFIVDIERVQNGKQPVHRGSIVKWLLIAIALVVLSVGMGSMFFWLYNNKQSVQQDYKMALSQASNELSLIHYSEARDAYLKAYAIQKNDSIAQKIESLNLLLQGIDAYTQLNYEEAKASFSKAESMNLPEASYYLGEMHYEGLGVPKDYNKGFSLVNLAYQNGFQLAGYRLGLVYKNGIGGVAADRNLADRYFESARQIIDKAAETGNPEWLYVKGNMYMYGDGVSKSENMAIDYYRKAAEMNYAPALYQLYVALDKTAPQQAMEYLTRSAEKGYVRAQALLGRILLDRREKQGYEWIRQAADQNYPYAIAQMGILYFNAKRLPANEPVQKMLNIESNDALSMNYLQKALQYDPENFLVNYGLGLYHYTERNHKEAEKYFNVVRDQISELKKNPYREDELKYPNLEKIRVFVDDFFKNKYR